MATGLRAWHGAVLALSGATVFSSAQPTDSRDISVPRGDVPRGKAAIPPLHTSYIS